MPESCHHCLASSQCHLPEYSLGHQAFCRMGGQPRWCPSKAAWEPALPLLQVHTQLWSHLPQAAAGPGRGLLWATICPQSHCSPSTLGPWCQVLYDGRVLSVSPARQSSASCTKRSEPSLVPPFSSICELLPFYINRCLRQMACQGVCLVPPPPESSTIPPHLWCLS